MDTGTEDPNRFIDCIGDGGDQKCLRWLDRVRKLDWPLRPLDCSKFVRNWLALGNEF